MISKVIQPGDPTSYYIHIPKKEVKAKGIKAGDYVRFEIQEVIKGD